MKADFDPYFLVRFPYRNRPGVKIYVFEETPEKVSQIYRMKNNNGSGMISKFW